MTYTNILNHKIDLEASGRRASIGFLIHSGAVGVKAASFIGLISKICFNVLKIIYDYFYIKNFILEFLYFFNGSTGSLPSMDRTPLTSTL